MRADWIEVELEKVCQIKMGQSPPSSTYNEEGKGLAFFQGKAEFTNLHPKAVKWCTEPKKTAEKGDILISVRAPVGATNMADQKCVIGRGLAAITFPFGNGYLWYYLKLIEKNLDSLGTGTTFKAISGQTLKSQKIPLPPLPEQRAIVARIEELFSELDHAVSSLQAAQAKLEIYRQAVLKKAFEGGFTSGENWELKKFRDYGTWKGGGTPSKANDSFWNNGSVLWVSPKDMKEKFISDTIDKITEEAIENSSTKWISGGSVLFVVRSGILRRILPIAISKVDLTVNQDLQAFTPNSDLDPVFVYWFCQSRERDIRKNCAKDGTTVESIDSNSLKNYLIPVCPKSEQNQIVQEIESRLSVADKMAETIQTSLQKAEALRQSILKKAFEGRLLTEAEVEACRKEADWEPAEKLLERIKQEKSKPKKS